MGKEKNKYKQNIHNLRISIIKMRFLKSQKKKYILCQYKKKRKELAKILTKHL